MSVRFRRSERAGQSSRATICRNVGEKRRKKKASRRASGNEPSVRLALRIGPALPKPRDPPARVYAKRARRGSSDRRVGVASCDAHAPSRRERGTGIQEQHAHRVDARTLDARVSRRSDVFLTTRFVALGEDDGVSRMERRRRGRDRRGHDRQDAESRAARRIERLASSFFRLDATRATPPRVVECHPWWFVSLRCQLGLKISEALRDEGRGKRTGRERGTPESSFTTQPARVP